MKAEHVVNKEQRGEQRAVAKQERAARKEEEAQEREARRAEAEEAIEASMLAHDIREADETGTFGESDETVPNEAFTVEGVTSDPLRAAVSGRPYLAQVLGRDQAGDPA
jgi:hypothetical protein